MLVRWTLLASIAATLPATAFADVLIVLNKSDHQAALVDPVSSRVIARLPTGQGPHEIAVSPDGRRAYVSNYGAYAVFQAGERPRMEPGRSITVLDLARRHVTGTFDLGDYRSPHGIATSRDGDRLWVTCEGNQAVVELDAKRGRVTRAWNTGQEVSHMLVPTPDETKLYVANIGSGSVTVIDRGSGGVKSIVTGAGAEGIDVSPDGREVWVVNRGADMVAVIDVATDSVVARLDSHGDFPIRVKFTPDGSQVWVSNAKSNRVVVFDAHTRDHVGSVEVGAVPVGIQMSPDGRQVFVANTNDDRVIVIDAATRKVTRSFNTGREPDGMAWAAKPGAAPRKAGKGR